jgi:serine/threonine protein kinase
VDEDLVVRSNARLGALLKGKYTLNRVLGIGGMATVYAATHRNGKEFAVKVLHADLSLRTDTRTRFLREGYLANRVNHPGAVAVLDDDVADDGGAFLVMELLRGQTLEAIWEAHRFQLPLPLVVGVGLQLLDVLAAAHSRGLIHRDIKPGNLMLTHDGQVKVLDFGIARLRDLTSPHATQTGTVMGTPAFMAPEHALAKTEEIDAQTDLWAVGATMFTLATGLLVHEGDNTQQILVKAATAPARPFAGVMSGAPRVVADVIDKALAFDKVKRWANATEMQKALTAAAREAYEVVPTAPVLSEMLDELGAHEKTSAFAEMAPPPADAVVPRSSPQVSLDIDDATDTGKTPIKVGGGTLAGIVPISVEPREKPPAVGLITAGAVATDSFTRRAVPKSRGVMAAAIALGTVGIGAVLFVATRGPSPKDAGGAASAVHAAPAAAPSASPSPAVSLAPPAGAWTAVTPDPHAAPNAHTPSVPVSALAPLRSPPRPVAPGQPPALGTPPAAPGAAPPSTATNKPGCNPPYEFDENGNKRWKRECL